MLKETLVFFIALKLRILRKKDFFRFIIEVTLFISMYCKLLAACGLILAVSQLIFARSSRRFARVAAKDYFAKFLKT